MVFYRATVTDSSGSEVEPDPLTFQVTTEYRARFDIPMMRTERILCGMFGVTWMDRSNMREGLC